MTTKNEPVITFEAYTDEDFDYVIDSHRRIFSKEFGWGEHFMDRVREITLTYANREKSDREIFLIAKADGKPVGSMMLIEWPQDPTVAQLRLLVVEEAYRGYKIGSGLMRTLLAKAKADGYRKVILWTVDELVVARQYYAKLGFVCTEQEENRLWHPDGTPVMEELWEMDL